MTYIKEMFVLCTILMSIKPEHTNNILLGNKKYEFRKD